MRHQSGSTGTSHKSQTDHSSGTDGRSVLSTGIDIPYCVIRDKNKKAVQNGQLF